MPYSTQNPAIVFIKLLTIVFVSEAAVMFLLPLFLSRSATSVVEALVDSCLLTLISGPLLWLVIIGPLRAAAKAEQMEVIAQLATGVAHELRNPLTAIKMLVQSHREARQDDKLMNQDLKVIEDEIRRMERAIQTFLDFGRPRRPDFAEVDLRKLIQRTIALVEPQAAEKEVNLHFTPSAIAVPVQADWEQIQQLLLNLTINALEASDEKGQIRFEIQPAPDHVRVTIEDDGPGISAGVGSRLFEPFVSDKKLGVGLGLVISKRIAEEHSGQLTGENVDSGGAQFTLTLPRVTREAVNPAGPQRHEAN